MKKIKVALVSHIIKDDNLGCGALAISNIRLMDQVFEDMNIDVEYVIATTDNLEKVDMSLYTKHSYEYRLYPRCKQTLKNPFKLLFTKVFKDCDIAFNLCGGDGYTDIYGFGRLMAESQLAWIAKLKHVPMVYSPQTIGPFQSRKGKLLAKSTLKKVSHIFVRDHQSFECCEKLKLDFKTSEVIDVAFALPYEKQNIISDKMKIGINVSGLLYNGGYNRNNYFGLKFDYKEFVNKLLAELCSDGNIEVHLIPHVNSYTRQIEDDYEVCENLSKKFGCILAPRFESPIDAKGYIAAMDLFSGARMHSTIGAVSSGVPVIPVAYSRKFNGLYGSLQYQWLIDAKSDMTVEDAIKTFFDYKNRISELCQSVTVAKEIYLKKLNDYKKELALVTQTILGENI